MNMSEAWQAIKDLSREKFEEKIKPQGLPEARKELLFKLIRCNIQISYSCKYDIKAYALKCLMPDFYELIAYKWPPYARGAYHEYDPPKNGQNIIKHGIGFGEVVSYSRKFGTLLVPIPNETDGRRAVILSDLDLKCERDKLELPPSGIREMNCTISIAHQREGKFRFISARLLSSKKKKYEETIAQTLGEITFGEQARQGFIERCIEILEKDLIQPTSSSYTN